MSQPLEIGAVPDLKISLSCFLEGVKKLEIACHEVFYEAKQVLRLTRDGVVRAVGLGCILRFR